MNDGGCRRDWAGFCIFALAGNPRCFTGRDKDRCAETSPEAARRHTVDAIVRRQRAAPKRPMREAAK